MTKEINMKYITIILLSLSCAFSALAQTAAIDYQTVLTDLEGDVLKNVAAEIRVDIIEGSAGTVVYSETHLRRTGSAGEIALEIGNGTPTSMTMDNVDWSKNNYIDIAIKPEGHPDFLSIGQRELFSVPYAFYALNLRCEQGCPGEKGPKGITGPQGPQGPKGPNGTQGLQGQQGIAGMDGIDFDINSMSADAIAPSNPSAGDFYLDDGSSRSDGNVGFRVWDGTQWCDL